ncbi:MAG: DUF5675 family protein [Candidatus Staskawiczbacteria bacterium]|jgi:hypothetical protein
MILQLKEITNTLFILNLNIIGMKPRLYYKLLLKYTDFLSYATLGELYIWQLSDDAFPKRFFTIQPPRISDTDFGKLIPCGVYPLRYSYMLKHEVMHYELLDVPNLSGIYIHGGNMVADTDGCILVGEKLVLPDLNGQYQLQNSKFAWQSIELYLNHLDSEITIYTL